MVLKKDIKERITNILKRMTFEYFKVIDIDNISSHKKVSATIENTITKETYKVEFSYEFLHYLSDEGLLKYNIIKDKIILTITNEENKRGGL